MKTEITRYVVQYKSVYEASGPWRDLDDAFLSIEEAKHHADALRVVNKWVRVVRRQITETVVS